MNQGVTSYLNAVLQTLFMTQEYREGVMRLKRRKDSSDGDFIEELKSLFHKLDNESHPVSTVGISRSLEITDVYEHKDAAEYLDLILSKTPELSEIFKVKVNNNGTCQSCMKRISEQSDYFRVEIFYTGSYNVETTLTKRINALRSDLSCSRCLGAAVMTNIKSQIDFPQRLILQMDHFHKNEWERIPLRVKVSSHRYELYAIINWYGTLKDGHYNANIKSDNGKWYRCDDSRVFQVSADMFLEDRRHLSTFERIKLHDGLSAPPAYLVFYKRRIN